MELLLAVPLSRTAFARQRPAATGVAVTLVAALPVLVLLLVVPGIGMSISLSDVAAAGAGLVALVWSFVGITFLTGAATGKRASVLAVAGAVAVAAYMATPSAGWPAAGGGCAGCRRSTTSSAPTRCTPAGIPPTCWSSWRSAG